jgi:hypothetical protein
MLSRAGTDVQHVRARLDAVTDGKKSRTPNFRSAPLPQNTDDDFSTDFERGARLRVFASSKNGRTGTLSASAICHKVKIVGFRLPNSRPLT